MTHATGINRQTTAANKEQKQQKLNTKKKKKQDQKSNSNMLKDQKKTRRSLKQAHKNNRRMRSRKNNSTMIRERQGARTTNHRAHPLPETKTYRWKDLKREQVYHSRVVFGGELLLPQPINIVRPMHVFYIYMWYRIVCVYI